MLSAAAIIYGTEFNPVIVLKAISYFSDPALAALPMGMKSDLATAVRSVDVKSLPVLSALRLKRLRA